MKTASQRLFNCQSSSRRFPSNSILPHVFICRLPMRLRCGESRHPLNNSRTRELTSFFWKDFFRDFVIILSLVLVVLVSVVSGGEKERHFLSLKFCILREGHKRILQRYISCGTYANWCGDKLTINPVSCGWSERGQRSLSKIVTTLVLRPFERWRLRALWFSTKDASFHFDGPLWKSAFTKAYALS